MYFDWVGSVDLLHNQEKFLGQAHRGLNQPHMCAKARAFTYITCITCTFVKSSYFRSEVHEAINDVNYEEIENVYIKYENCKSKVVFFNEKSRSLLQMWLSHIISNYLYKKEEEHLVQMSQSYI